MQTSRETLFHHRPWILVLGGTGAAGHEVAERLWDSGCPIRVGTRFADPPFDWRERKTWAPVLRNVQAVYLGFHPGQSARPAERVLPGFIELAVATGVGRIVLVSRPDEVPARRSENIVREAGIDWTIIRVAAGLTDGVADRMRPPCADGIAALAVAALTRTGRSETLHELAADRCETVCPEIAGVAC